MKIELRWTTGDGLPIIQVLDNAQATTIRTLRSDGTYSGELIMQARALRGPEDGLDVEALIAGVVRHGKDRPDHGPNCSCLDDAIRQLRTAIFNQIPVDAGLGRRLDARWRISHVLNSILRRL